MKLGNTKILQPLGLLMVLGAYIVQSTNESVSADVTNIQTEVLNTKIDYLMTKADGTFIVESRVDSIDSTLVKSKICSSPELSAVDNYKRIENKMEKIAQKYKYSQNIACWMYILGSILIIIEAFFSAKTKE